MGTAAVQVQIPWISAGGSFEWHSIQLSCRFFFVKADKLDTAEVTTTTPSSHQKKWRQDETPDLIKLKRNDKTHWPVQIKIKSRQH